MKYKVVKIKSKKFPKGFYFRPKRNILGIWFNCGKKFASKARAIKSIMDNKDKHVQFV